MARSLLLERIMKTTTTIFFGACLSAVIGCAATTEGDATGVATADADSLVTSSSDAAHFAATLGSPDGLLRIEVTDTGDGFQVARIQGERGRVVADWRIDRRTHEATGSIGDHAVGRDSDPEDPAWWRDLAASPDGRALAAVSRVAGDLLEKGDHPTLSDALSTLAGITPYIERSAVTVSVPAVDEGAYAVESSSGCTGKDECIYVDGTDLWVNTVKAKYTNRLAPRFCGRQVLAHRQSSTGDVYRRRSPILCAKQWEDISYTFFVSRMWGDGDRVCVYLTTDPDAPCETIHG